MNGHALQRDINRLLAAVERLEEALNEGLDNPLAIDGTIQRFEFTYELMWKALKRLLEARGARHATPRDVFRAAYQAGMLDDEQTWLRLLDMRNKTSHTYKESTAQEVYRGIQETFPVINETARKVHLLAAQEER